MGVSALYAPKKSITATAELWVAGCNAPDWSVSHYIVPHENQPPRQHAAFYQNSLITLF